MVELVLRMSCATPAAECADTNQGPLLQLGPPGGLVQLGALIVIALLLVFVVRARRRR